MRRSSEVTITASGSRCAEQLARFFPHTKPVCIPVQVTVVRTGNALPPEETLVEFGGLEHAIFVSGLPLEFDDRVRIGRDRNGSPAEAAVIAVQYHDGCKAVAVRFLDGPCDWVA